MRDRAVGRLEPIRPSRGLGRELVGQVEAGEDRDEIVEAIRAAADDGQRQVDLGVGAGRDHGRPPAPSSARALCQRRAGRGPRRAPSRPRPRASAVADRERCRRPAAQPRCVPARAIGSWRGRTLWSILRRSRKPAWTTRQSRSSPSASRRRARVRPTSTAESTSGAGSKADAGTTWRMRDVSVVLDEDREVAHATRRRRDALGDLALDHQHEAVGPRLVTQDVVQDRARDVVRDVGDQVPRRPDEVTDRTVEDVVVDEAEGRVGDGVGEASAQVVDHAADRPRRPRRGRRRAKQGTGQDADAGPDLEDLPRVRAGARLARTRWHRCIERGRGDDRLEHGGVGQEVLAVASIRAQAVGGQVPAEGFGSEVARIEGIDDACIGRSRRALRRSLGHQPATSRRDGEAPRSSPARSPARNRRLPAAPIMAALSVHRPGRGMISSAPSAAARSSSAARRPALAATPPPTMIERAEMRWAARRRLGRQHVDDGCLERDGQLADERRRG